ncbi:MAG: LolA family protein, partial [Candidatus Kapaibacteriota bacterium]
MPLVSATDKDKVFEQLCARFDGVKSLRIHFKALNQRFSGVLTFARPDKFRVEFYSDNKIQRIIVSNGKSLWN